MIKFKFENKVLSDESRGTADAVVRASLPNELKGKKVELEHAQLHGCKLAAECKPLGLTVDYELSPACAGEYELQGVNYSWRGAGGEMQHEHWSVTPMSEMYVESLINGVGEAKPEKNVCGRKNDVDYAKELDELIEELSKMDDDNKPEGSVFGIIDVPRQINPDEFVELMSPLCSSFEITIRNYMIDRHITSIKLGVREGLSRVELDKEQNLIGVDLKGEKKPFMKYYIGQIVSTMDHVMYLVQKEG